MKTLRSVKRSVSPFGVPEPQKDLFDEIKDYILAHHKEGKPNQPPQLNLFQDVHSVPFFMRQAANAPAHDNSPLQPICEYLLKYNLEIVEDGLFEKLFKGMEFIFNKKTEIFLIDHHDKEHCEKLGLKEEYKDVVLYASERDALIGKYFEPATKENPGIFSEFISHWIESENLDRVLHFLDFCSGSNNPTLEHYLVFTQPALTRVMRNKNHLKDIFRKVQPLLVKLNSPTWEKDIRLSLQI